MSDADDVQRANDKRVPLREGSNLKTPPKPIHKTSGSIIKTPAKPTKP